MTRRGVSRRTFLSVTLGATAVTALDLHPLGALVPRDVRVPQPTDVLVSRWGSDPYARGALSYRPVGSSATARRDLALPVSDRLFFAGEATSVDHPGTVHGALLSGRRAAREVSGVARAGASIVIVGAGIAGLAAAAHLQVQGFQVVVLEARDRIGGRISTSHAFGVPVELGALWLLGATGNPLARVADHLGALRVTTSPARTIVYASDDRALSPVAAAQLDASYQTAVDQADATRAHLGGDVSLGSTLAATRPFRTATPAQLGLLDYEVSTKIVERRAADVDSLSLLGWDEGHPYPGADQLIRGGFDQIVVHAARDLDVQRRVVVRDVAWTDSSVTLTTTTQPPRAADHVIVTLPLGVLQAGAVTFTPALPDAKTQAVASLGSGVVDHVALRFPRVFWDAQADLIGHVDAHPGRWPQWVNLAGVTGQPILLGVNAGSYAQMLEGESDEAVVADALDVLRSVYA